MPTKQKITDEDVDEAIKRIVHEDSSLSSEATKLEVTNRGLSLRIYSKEKVKNIKELRKKYLVPDTIQPDSTDSTDSIQSQPIVSTPNFEREPFTRPEEDIDIEVDPPYVPMPPSSSERGELTMYGDDPLTEGDLRVLIMGYLNKHPEDNDVQKMLPHVGKVWGGTLKAGGGHSAAIQNTLRILVKIGLKKA